MFAMIDKWRFYIKEARTQIEFAGRSWVAFIEAEEQGSVLDIFLYLQHFLSHPAIVDKILEPSAYSRRRHILSHRIDLSGIDLKPFRRLRNHLEHFDERFDKWVSEYDSKPFFDMNLVTGTKGFPKNAFLRALDGHVYKFHGEDYDLEQLHNALVSIEQRLPKEDDLCPG
jgi:hypothetical protein